MTLKMDNNARIKELETIAGEILKLKKETNPRRPIIVEFCGSPKAGKSSCISALDLFLRRNKYKTKVLTERASVCPINDKFDPFFNIWTATSAISELSEILSNSPKDYDIVFLDRGIFDALCWFTWLLERNAIDKDNYNSLIGFLTMKKWRAAIDLVYVFTAHPKESLKREYAYLLTRKTGRIMRPKVLDGYNAAISRTIKSFNNKFRKVEKFDTSKVSIEDGNYKITHNVLSILLEGVVERIGHTQLKNTPKSNKTKFYLNEYEKLASTHLTYDRRDNVEINDNLVQPIPIAVITDKKRSKILVAKKKRTANGQTSLASPEKDKILVYFGGHIREEDSICIGTDRLLATSKCALQRELKEELSIDYCPPTSDDNPLCIWVKEGARSSKHMAICFIVEVDFDLLKIRLDRNEFITKGNTKSGTVMDTKSLFMIYGKMEEWSRTILREHFGYKLQKQDDLFENNKG